LKKSLSYLGSKELYVKIIQDLNNLMLHSFDNNLIPLQLVVGQLFVEMSCVHSLISDFNLKDWESSCLNIPKELSFLFDTRYKEVLKVLEEKQGVLGYKDTVGIYFDPEEPYMCLYAIDPNTSAEPHEMKTGDGYLILKLSYKEEDYTVKLIN